MPWYDWANPPVQDLIEALAACQRELVEGPQERLWYRLSSSHSYIERSPPQPLIWYYFPALPAYRLFRRAFGRVKMVGKLLDNIQLGRTPSAPLREPIREQLGLANNELLTVNERIFQLTRTFCYAPLRPRPQRWYRSGT